MASLKTYLEDPDAEDDQLQQNPDGSKEGNQACPPRTRSARGANGRGNGKRESLIDRFKVWARHDGESQNEFYDRKVIGGKAHTLRIPMPKTTSCSKTQMAAKRGIKPAAFPPITLTGTDSSRHPQYEFSRERYPWSSRGMSNRCRRRPAAAKPRWQQRGESSLPSPDKVSTRRGARVYWY
jgi:hypothetical protein